MMMVSLASKGLCTSYQSVRRFPNSTHTQALLLVQKRFRQLTREEQRKCKKEEEEACPKKSRRWLTIAGVAIVGTAAAVVVAKNDDDFRAWSKDYLPPLDSLVKIVYEEEETYLEFLSRVYKDLTAWIKQKLYDLSTGAKTPGIKDPVSQAKPVTTDKLYKHDSKPAVLPKPIKDLKDLETKMFKAAKDAIDAYQASANALKDHAKLIDQLDQLISKQDIKAWEPLAKKRAEAEKNLEKAEAANKKFQENMSKFYSHLESEPAVTKEMKEKAHKNMKTLTNDIEKAKENFDKDREKMKLVKRAWPKVRQARLYFTEELETLFPDIWLNDEKLNIPEDGLDPFIRSVLNNISYLDNELVKLQTLREAEANSAVERFRQSGDYEGLVNAIVNLESSKELRHHQEELQKMLLTQKAKCDKQARALMKQQLDVYKDLRAEALALKEKDVERKMEQMQEERLAQLRLQYQMEIAKMVGRIEGANDAISKRENKDQDQQERQKFWSATQSLLSAAKPFGAAKDATKPLKNEISNVVKTAPKDDELVEKVVESIPKGAVEEGIESEVMLKERFLKVEKDARYLAGVPEGYVTLLQLLVARLQSWLYIDQPIPDTELNNEPIDVSQLNNYEIIQRARFYVDRGEFEQAVKYLNQLKGPAGKVSSEWVKDVITHLETVQAAELLLAYASAFNS